MDNTFLVFILLPLIVGGGVLAGAWLLTRFMPGEGKALTAKEAAQLGLAGDRGPDYVRLSSKRKAAFRTGIMILLALAVLTIVEFFLSSLGSIALMFVIMILKAALIMYFFMHIATVWRTEEAH